MPTKLSTRISFLALIFNPSEFLAWTDMKDESHDRGADLRTEGPAHIYRSSYTHMLINNQIE